MKTRFYIGVIVIASVVHSISGQTGKKSSIGILVDNTGSMRSQSAMQRETAKAVAKQAKAADALVSIFGFVPAETTANIAAGLECSTDTDLVMKQIDAIETVRGQTMLYDAIDVAAGRIKKPAANCPTADEHILVLLSDGQDRASRIKADDLLKSLRQSGVKVYVVAMVDELSIERGFTLKSARAKSEDFLKRLVSGTGGRIVFPKSKESVQDIVNRLFSEKAEK